MLRALALSIALLAPMAAGAQELHVFAGAGLREPVDQLAAVFEKTSGTKVVVEYGGSGQMLARITETGGGDLFIPGSMTYFAALDKEGGITDRHPLAIHGAVLAVNKAAADRIRTFADIAKPGIRLGLGDAKAMALGRTADEIIEHSGHRDSILANVAVRAATVKQLALYVANGDVDAAIVGGPEVAKNAATLVGVAIPAELYEPEMAGVAVLKASAHPKEAKAFAELLASDEGRAAFAAAGFPPAPR